MTQRFPAARRNAGLLIAAIFAFAAIVPVALAAPDANRALAPLAPPAANTDGALLAVTAVSPAPANAKTGVTYELTGTVANSGAVKGGGPLVVRLLQGGQAPLAIGRTSVDVPAGATRAYSVDVTPPAELAAGSYSLVACVQRADIEGELGCASARRAFVVGAADPVRGSAVRAVLARRVDPDPTCAPGARTLSKPGDHVYPDQGNGGYTSLHTDVNLVFDGASTEFLEGTNVVLRDRAEECLSEFSLDFAEQTADVAGQLGADMEVEAVFVNGEEAGFRFAQPTFPGNPNGADDPDPLAHQAGQDTPVSATNPNPPACSPVGAGEGPIGEPCAANKLVIVPDEPIQAGEEFDVKVEYSGRPGVFTDGDGSVEGWFRSTTPDGIDSIVVTEPVGGQVWMPLNNHPTAKPTYDFSEKVSAGMTAIANGELISSTANVPDADFPAGSTTWVWHSPEPVASYLVASSIVNFDLSERLGEDGTLYYTAETPLATPAQAAQNQAIIATHEEVTEFQERFSGPYPFTSNGIVVGINNTFAEEMQTKIAINRGRVRAGTFHHENFHQWWGDNVSESGYEETFFKEGLAELSGIALLGAKEAAEAAGGLDTPAGAAAFEAAMVEAFTTTYVEEPIRWENPPSDPSPATLFEDSSTYERTAAAYIALRQILGHGNFDSALRQIQQQFAGGNVTVAAAEQVFHGWMPNQSAACADRLDQFFSEWFDTSFALADGTPSGERPRLTGPGLPAGETGLTFYNADGSCTDNSAPVTTASVLPSPVGGQITGPATVVLTATDDSGTVASTEYSLDDSAFQAYEGPVEVAALGTHIVEYRSTDRDGAVEATRKVTFTIVAPPVPAPAVAAPPVVAPRQVCAQPRLSVAIVKPLREQKGAAIVLKGRAYRFTGRLTCSVGGKRAAAPEGTAVSISSIANGRTSRQPGVAVGRNGAIDTLLRFSGKRTVVFGFAADGAKAQVRIRIGVARR
jgi:hypothetical protein